MNIATTTSVTSATTSLVATTFLRLLATQGKCAALCEHLVVTFPFVTCQIDRQIQYGIFVLCHRELQRGVVVDEEVAISRAGVSHIGRHHKGFGFQTVELHVCVVAVTVEEYHCNLV